MIIDQFLFYTYRHQSGYRKNHSTLTILMKLRDDIERTMKRGEVTLAVFADFSKAFFIIFNIRIHKLHSLYFSKDFFYLIWNYLSNRNHFLQIDSSCSILLYSKFGVTQESISVSFNLCATDMNNVSSCACIQ